MPYSVQFSGSTPLGANIGLRITYLRAVQRWHKDRRTAHRKVQSRKARQP